MKALLQTVNRKTYQLCRQYPGGIRSMFEGVRNEHGLGESSIYADLNPNSEQSTLRVWELIRVMEATGNVAPLREIANYFGYSLSFAEEEQPDAPTLEAEALQDYPPLVDFHKGCQRYRDKTPGDETTITDLDRLKDEAIHEIRETFVRTVKGDER